MPWSDWKYYASQTLLALVVVAIIAPGVIWWVLTFAELIR